MSCLCFFIGAIFNMLYFCYNQQVNEMLVSESKSCQTPKYQKHRQISTNTAEDCSKTEAYR